MIDAYSVYFTNDRDNGIVIGVGRSGQMNNSDKLLDLEYMVELRDVLPSDQAIGTLFNSSELKRFYKENINGNPNLEKGLKIEKSKLVNQCVVPVSEC